jgi:hypothetical protein
MNLGLLPEDAIIADRAANTRSSIDAHLGYPAVQEVDYDPRKNPGRFTVQYNQEGPGGISRPPQRLEMYINKL